MLQLRKEHKLTQEQVAEYLAVGQRTYSDYETGTSRITAETIISLARFYDVNIDYFMGVTKERRPFPKH